LRLKRRIGTREDEAEVLNEIGNAHRALREYDTARASHHLAMTIMRTMGERPGECVVRNDLGRTLRESGDIDRALEQHRVVLAEATRIKLRYEQARALDGIAACLRTTEPEAARQHWQRALVLCREMGVPEQSEVEHALAELAQASPSTRDSRTAPSTTAMTPETR
jgi:tetratricopeptide (TPR) repeat protein